MPTSNIDILEAVRENPNFRQELLTNEYSQVIEMNIEPGSSVGEQVCEGDAVLVIVEGCGEAVLNRKHSPVQNWQPGRSAGRHTPQHHQHGQRSAQAVRALRPAA